MVETGNGVLIGGFVVQGTTPKEVLIRGLGPSLSAFGVRNPLSDPMIELHDATGALISSNDNWQTDSNQGSIPGALQPSNALESALYRTLDPGTYTVIMKGPQGQTGVGLFELYEMNGTGSILANISTRGTIQTGDNVMIGGFIVTGDANVTQRVIVRAIGPSLARFGVPNCLPNPHLRVFDSNGTLIGENDDWQSTQAAEIGATGLAPVDPLESAIVLNLPVGSYTAIVFDTGGQTGNGLVEVYSLGQ